ncbi:MAG TPA: hypothetical protein DDW94_03150 [Deltaproteobacteria bacterium]|nr:MAG: hypothetical protein A2Z79_09845 [Deltaproteobacteria bacterium GWA2_55_82]OGQ62498.1 MAG: hypothetical protein A3I81_08430 [Deltaproteobacteria bacterium RIFCSPLOWO2_02_FULL_55_12]OIJ73025.1 MAG: hypothetical protein A2V21_301365 [Deltaproteobacteria bacterium GWC2_55_46]HBG45965.1 hypothetical protein [Deltaproteobacteria bacterium]HCY11816.1 hypothetical protein [Deltaproteobacteria bacterium]
MIGDLKKHLQSIDLRSLGRFRQEAIGVIALMAISIFFYRFVYLGNKAELAKINADIANGRAEIALIEAEARSARGLDMAVEESTRNLEALEERHRSLTEKLPSDRHISKLLSEFTGSANTDLKVVAIKPLQPEDKGELARLPFQITLESRFIPLGNYIERLEHLPRLMVVDNLTIEPSEDGSSVLKSNIFLSAYVLGYGGGK